MKLLIDTNIWIRYFDLSSPLSSPCRAAVDKAAEHGHEICICAQVMIEFWAVATRPKVANGLGMALEEADLNLTDMLQICTLLLEPPDIGHRWRTLANKVRATGKAVHDLRLVALMQAHGITDILTLNPADFKRYSEITAVEPTEA